MARRLQNNMKLIAKKLIQETVRGIPFGSIRAEYPYIHEGDELLTICGPYYVIRNLLTKSLYDV